MKKGLIHIILAIVLSGFLLVPVFAEVSSSKLRHSVVYVEFGLEGDAGYTGLSSGTGFFVGKTNVDPQFFLTNHHVVESFIELGRGENILMDFSKFTEWVAEYLYGTPLEALNDPEEVSNIAEQIWIQFMGYVEFGYFKPKIRVYFDKDDFEEGFLIDYDSVKDMALLRLAAPTNKRSALAISIPVEEMVGDKKVFVVGYPGIADNEYFKAVHINGENDATVTPGAISRLFIETGTGRSVIQTSADIAHGNSGGPMIFENGAVIGINSWNVNDIFNLEKVNYALSMEEVIPMLKNNNIDIVVVPYPDHVPFVIIGIVVAAVLAVAAAKIIPGIIHPVDPKDTGYRIQFIGGKLAQKRVMIPTNEKVKIGRETDNGIVFPKDTKAVSRHHCVIWVDRGTVFIQDLGSSFGTYVEPGNRLSAQETVPVHVGKRYWLGSENECFMIQKKS